MIRINAPIAIWWKAARFHFTPGSILPAFLGTAIALQWNNTFNIWYFFLLITGLICNNIALNMSDDYFDYKYGADRISKSGTKNKYSGGSGVLTSKEMTPETMREGFLFLYGIVVVLGLYLAAEIGWIILILGIFGLFSSYYYTAPPIKLAYHGLGEIMIFICHGPLIIVGSYYVQAQNIPVELIMLSLPIGLLMFCKILANELPDYLEDLNAGKKNLVVRLGKKRGLKLLIFSLIAVYFVIVLNVLLGFATTITLCALLTVVIAYNGVLYLKQTLNTKNLRGNLEIMQTNDYTVIILIIAHCIATLVENKMTVYSSISVAIILVALALFYTPIAMKFRRDLITQQLHKARR